MPYTDWLQSKCAQAQIDLQRLPQGDQVGKPPCVYGLALVVIQYAEPLLSLAAWDREGDILHEYFGWPRNAFSARITGFVALQEPQPCKARASLDQDRFLTATTPNPHALDAFYPYQADAWALTNGMTVPEQIAAWSELEPDSVPVFNVVSPILELIIAGHWDILVFRKSWPIVTSIFPSQHLSRVSDSMELCPPPKIDLSSNNLESLAQQLRSWAPAILTSAVDDDDRTSTEMHLSAAVAMLQGASRSLDASYKGRVSEGRGGHRQYATTCLLQALRTCRLLKSSSDLGKAITSAISTLFPDLISQSLIQQWEQGALRLPSSSTMYRCRILLDVALVLWRRQITNQHHYVRYGWADSSLQLQRDWLLCTLDEIRADQIIDVGHSGFCVVGFLRSKDQGIMSLPPMSGPLQRGYISYSCFITFGLFSCRP